jgi:hypothetical protein
MTSSEQILQDAADGVATVTLNRPDAEVREPSHGWLTRQSARRWRPRSKHLDTVAYNVT